MGLDILWKKINSKPETYDFTKEEFLKWCHKAGSTGWKAINPNYIERYISGYKLSHEKAFSKSQKNEVAKSINGLIKSQEYVRAAKYIDAFEMNDHFDCVRIAGQLINRDNAELAVKLVSRIEDKSAMKEIISRLDFFKYNALASSAIKSNGLNPHDFPKLLSHQVYGALRSFVKRHDWFKAEEIALQRYHFYHDKSAFTTFVKVLIKNKQFDEAYSVIQRHGDKVQEYVIRQLKGKAKPKNRLDNILWETDLWGPTEVGLKGEKIEEYLTLEDLGVKKSDVYFIDDDSTKEFKAACEHLLAAKMVIFFFKGMYF